jgi:ferritin
MGTHSGVMIWLQEFLKGRNVESVIPVGCFFGDLSFSFCAPVCSRIAQEHHWPNPQREEANRSSTAKFQKPAISKITQGKGETNIISKTIEDAINEQIKNELYSAYLYLSMSAHFESNNLQGFAHWMRVQFQEEQAHAMRFFDYVNDRGGRVTLEAIEQPPAEWKSSLEAFAQVLEHEQKVTGLINKLYELAVKENDYATQVTLQWFITEQVEEEKHARQIIEQLKLIDAHGTAVLMLDHQLGKRGKED